MTCKIDHNADDCGIPRELCRVCSPIRASEAIPGPALETPTHTTGLERMQKREKKRLRAEVKEWRSRVDLMRKHKTSASDMAKAEEALRQREHALYLIA